MKLSIGNNNTNFYPIELSSIDELCETIQKSNYSQSIFNDNYRNLKNFISTDLIALDVDNEGPNDNFTIEQAAEQFKDYQHIIATSRSHRKDKNGKVADRFRVILFLDKTVTSAKDFTATWHSIYKFYPAIDTACKDASRYFYPSPSVFSKNSTGKKWAVSYHVEAEVKESFENIKGKGQLSLLTLDFLLQGAPQGKRNERLFKTAKDMHEQGFSKEETTMKVNLMIKNGGSWAHTELTDRDLQTIASAYSNEPKYDRRQSELTKNPSFRFKTAKELLNSSENVEWIVEDLLTAGGLSVMAGPPKAGKSTLMRQLVLSVSRGGEFLGRQVKKGRVIYLALEEQEGVLKEQYEMAGLTENDNLIIHSGGIESEDPIRDLRSAILEFEPSLVVIDTLFLLMNTESVNDYKQVNAAMAQFRNLSREVKTHFITVHHTKKDGEATGANKILGSVAIHGAVDTALILGSEGDRRFLTTSQRHGKTFSDQEIVYNADTNTYALGQTKSNKGF